MRDQIIIGLVLGMAVAGMAVAGACTRRTIIPATPAPTAGISASSGADILAARSDNQPPDTPENLYRAGLAAFREFTPSGYKRAIALFKRAADLAPSECDYHLHVAEANAFLAYEKAENHEDFAAALSETATPECGAGTAFGFRLDAMRNLYLFTHEPGNFPNNPSAAFIAKAIELEPDDPISLYVQSKAGNDRPLLKAAEIAPDLALIQYELGMYWLQRRDYATAREAFERAIRLSPAHYRSYVGLAESIFSLDEGESVDQLFARAVELAPDYLDGRLASGDFRSFMMETDLAAEQYLAAIQHNSGFVPAYLHLASAYLQAERWEEAEKAARGALEASPSESEAYYDIGSSWYGRKDLGRAEENYKAALEITPIYPDASYGLGTVYLDENLLDAALEQFDKVIHYAPNHANAYYSRALILARRQDAEGAIKDCDQAIKFYQQELDKVVTALAKSEARGYIQAAEFQRKHKDRLEKLMTDVRTLKARLP